MFTLGNDEAEKLPKVGDTIECQKCGEDHPVKSGKDTDGNDSPLIQYYKCGEKTYLCGVNGKDITGRFKK